MRNLSLIFLLILYEISSNQLKSALINFGHNDPLLTGNQLTKDDFIFLKYQPSDIKSHRLLSQSDVIPLNPNQHYHAYYSLNQSHTLLPFLTMNGEFTPSLCQSTPFFVPSQRSVCLNYLELIPSAIRGLSLAISECENQFSTQRWNCRGHNHTILFETPTRVRRNLADRIYRTYMDRLIYQSNKEAAYFLAISSAGVVHSVTKACAAGQLSKCGCDTSEISYPGAFNNHEWKGCSENVHFGDAFARDFLDPKLARRLRKYPQSTITNLHNSLVGRKAVLESMTKKCTCHGTSGSCQMKACFRTLSDFRLVGNALKEMYKSSKKIKVVNRKLHLINEPMHYDYYQRFVRNSRRLPRNMQPLQGPPTDNQLVYLNYSPSYCDHNRKYGTLGTTGRVCQIDEIGQSHCNELCCGRGFIEEVHHVETKCNCKFKWCCKVECETCEETVKIYRCR